MVRVVCDSRSACVALLLVAAGGVERVRPAEVVSEPPEAKRENPLVSHSDVSSTSWASSI